MLKIKIVIIIFTILPVISSSQVVNVGSGSYTTQFQEQTTLVEMDIQVEALKYRELHYHNPFQQTTGGLTC